MSRGIRIQSQTVRKARFCFRYDFHPVGQGLFASGELHARGGNSPRRWVFDCGTSSKGELLDRALASIVADWGGVPRPVVDLVALSHFDRDHINGVVRLLQCCEVRRLLLPFAPLQHRIVAAFGGGIASTDPLLRFFVNPGRYLVEQGGQVGEIVYVPPSEGDGPADAEDHEEEGGDEQVPPDWEFQQAELPAEESGLGSTDGAGGERVGQVSQLAPKSAIALPAHWEFVTYNDPTFLQRVNPDFQQAVAQQRNILLAPDPGGRHRPALQALEDAYNVAFGKGSRQRNDISLFLLGRPLKRKLEVGTLGCVPSRASAPPLPRQGLGWVPEDSDPKRRLGILYTGDGRLAEPIEVTRLVKYLGARRTGDIGVLQVMHHGSKKSSSPAAAAALQPDLSVYCSKPSWYGHPHRETQEHFAASVQCQVDESVGLSVVGVVG